MPKTFNYVLQLKLTKDAIKHCTHECNVYLNVLGIPLIIESFLLIRHSLVGSLHDFLDVEKRILLNQNHLYTFAPNFIVVPVKFKTFVHLSNKVLSRKHIFLIKGKLNSTRIMQTQGTMLMHVNHVSKINHLRLDNVVKSGGEESYAEKHPFISMS